MVFLLICKSSLDNKDINHLCITIVYTFSFAFPAQFLHLGLTYNGFRCTEIEILCNQAYQSFCWWFLPWFLCLESSPLSKFQFQWNNYLHFLLLVLQPCCLSPFILGSFFFKLCRIYCRCGMRQILPWFLMTPSLRLFPQHHSKNHSFLPSSLGQDSLWE